MKSKIILSFLSVFLCSTLFAQNFKLISESSNSILFENEVNEFIRNTYVLNGKNYHNFSKDHKVLTSELGAPALPFFSQAVQVSNRGNVSYELVYDDIEVIENIEILPSKGNLKRNVNPADVPFTFGEIYEQNSFYPQDLVKVSEPFILKNTRGVSVSFYPYQYNPVEKKLLIYKNMWVKVITDASVMGINELNSSVNTETLTFQSIYKSLYLNESPIYTAVSEVGSLLIVTAPEYYEVLEPLVEWKIQSGIKTTVVSTNETGTTSKAIKSFISDYYTLNPDLTFIILVGDSDKIPSHTYGYIWGEDRWSDSYYGQLSGGENDFYPEALVGRFSGNADEIEIMINRILDYEKTPFAGTWMKNAIGVASDEGDGYGNDGESDYQHLRNIRTQLQAFGYEDAYEFYQGTQGGEDLPGEPTPTMINDAMDIGIGLFNYTGHGWTEGVSTGNYTNSDVWNLENYGKYPFVVSVACNNGTFVDTTSLGESFLRANVNGVPTGAIAFAGSSILMAWAEPMATQDEMTNILTEYYSTQRNATIGGLFYNAQIGMLAEYGNSETAKEVMQTWVLFGDPSVLFRYDVTQAITASHATTITSSDMSFLITDCNAESGIATLSQNFTIIGTGVVVGGNVEITFEEDLDFEGENPVLTIVKQNYAPYQSEVALSTLGVNDLMKNTIVLYPNPTAGFVNLSWDNSMNISQIELYDLSGRLLMLNSLQSLTDTTYRFDVSQFNRGTYIVNLKVDGKTISKKLVIK